MSAVYPDWYRSAPEYGWASQAGLRDLRRRVEELSPRVSLEGREWQAVWSAPLLDHIDVLAIRATGDGKTLLTVIPTIARPTTLTLVISPLNMLENNMAGTFESFGLRTVVINNETLSSAARAGRDLWAEALHARIVELGPEQLKTDRFEEWRKLEQFRRKIALTVIEEVHVMDEWADDFRPAYAAIGQLRARLPPWVSYLGVTATCRPGVQTCSILDGLGFRHGRYQLFRGDCERHDLRIVVRPILHGVSGNSFPDLDWLVPEFSTREGLLEAKTIVYCNSIELGHRVAGYLRRLLPEHLRSHQLSLIRHVHSLCCDDCKKEALDALCDADGALPCAIEVATDVIGFGVDARRVQRVVCFDVPKELNTLLQRIGRMGNRGDLESEAQFSAFIYLKESTLRDALVTQLIEDQLPKKELSLMRELHMRKHDIDSSRAPKGQSHTVQHASLRVVKTLQAASQQPKTLVESTARSRAMTAFVQAFMHVYCLVLRLNQLYGNPGTKPCGRCSSCIEDKIPSPRSAAPTDAVASAVIQDVANTASSSQRATMSKDLVAHAVTDLDLWFAREWFRLGDTTSFLDSTTYVDRTSVKLIASRLQRLKTMDDLHSILSTWRFWVDLGAKLWVFVEELRRRYKGEMELEKKAQERAKATEKRKRAADAAADKNTAHTVVDENAALAVDSDRDVAANKRQRRMAKTSSALKPQRPRREPLRTLNGNPPSHRYPVRSRQTRSTA